tara:strand:- start:289 stop:780 length:492 start_codon:yes stop_codon:yes gene_type:complete
MKPTLLFLLLAFNFFAQVERSNEIIPPPRQNYEEIDVVKEVFEFPDILPVFPCYTFYNYDDVGNKTSIKKEDCGTSAMMYFIMVNLNYPEKSIQKNEQGRVFLAFVVEKNGSITDIKVEKGVSPALNNAAIKVVSLMPKWIPGESGGKKVRCRSRLPINFQLN